MSLAAADPTGVLSSHRTMSTGKKNFDALTGLRFFAAVAVVFYHFLAVFSQTGPPVLANWVQSGFVAVSFFYLLSGFVLSYSYVGARGEMRGTRRAFWTARFARIYPAYLLAFLIAAPYNTLWTLRVNTLHAGILKLTTGAVAVLSMQQAWTPWTAWYWNYPAWSVSAEAFFYLAFPFVALKLKRFTPKGCLIGMGTLWLLAVAPSALFLLSSGAGASRAHLQMAIEFTPLFRLPEFLMGVLMGRAYVLGFRVPAAVARWSGYLGLLAIAGCLAVSSAIPRPLLAGGLLAPLFAIVIFAFAEGEGWLARFLSRRTLVLLGEASYGIYILQIPVAYVLRVPPPLHSLTVFFGYFVVLIGAALLSWRFVEAPLRVYLRDWLNGGPPAGRRPKATSAESVASPGASRASLSGARALETARTAEPVR